MFKKKIYRYKLVGFILALVIAIPMSGLALAIATIFSDDPMTFSEGFAWGMYGGIIFTLILLPYHLLVQYFTSDRFMFYILPVAITVLIASIGENFNFAAKGFGLSVSNVLSFLVIFLPISITLAGTFRMIIGKFKIKGVKAL